MAVFQGFFFLILGVGIALVLYQSLSRGWLPCGPNGFKGRLEIHRDRHPAWFWLLFSLYTVACVLLVVFALRLLTGYATPLPLQ